MKKVVIFGSTGTTGLCATEAAVKKGLQVRAFVRDPKKMPDDLKHKVEIFEGNALEPDSVMNAVDGNDGVIIVLGTGTSLEPSSYMSEGTKIILEAMRAKNVMTVSVCLSGYLLYEPDMIPPKFVNINEDHKRMFQVVKESGLNWIGVCPPHVTDEPSRELIIQVNPEMCLGRLLSKWDLGAFLVNSLDEPKYYKSLVFICNKYS